MLAIGGHNPGNHDEVAPPKCVMSRECRVTDPAAAWTTDATKSVLLPSFRHRRVWRRWRRRSSERDEVILLAGAASISSPSPSSLVDPGRASGRSELPRDSDRGAPQRRIVVLEKEGDLIGRRPGLPDAPAAAPPTRFGCAYTPPYFSGSLIGPQDVRDELLCRPSVAGPVMHSERP